MSPTVLVGTDGSEASLRSIAASLALLATDASVVLVVVADPPDASLVTGGGHAGGTMTAEEFEALTAQQQAEAQGALEGAAQVLQLDGHDARVVTGVPGPTLVALAAEVGADAIVVGTRGRGGLKRALLGSVSDHVVRHAAVPVIVANDPDDA